MIFEKMKISQKVLILIMLSLAVLVSFAVGTITMAKNQLATLEEIYTQKVVPLDNLRKIQAYFREIEYRMTGVIADVVSAIGSGEHLKIVLKEVEDGWNDIKDSITDERLVSEKERFERGLKGFKEFSVKLQRAYFDNDPDMVEELIDEYLDYKPLLFKSLDLMAEKQEQAVKAYNENKQKAVTRVNSLVVIFSVIAIVLFLAIGIAITRSITRPVNETITMLQDIAKGEGDLTKRLREDSTDEVGVLAQWFNKFVEGMQTMVSSLQGVSHKVFSTSVDLGRTSKAIHESAKKQLQAIEETSSSTGELSSSINAIAGDTDELQKFTEDASSAAYEVSAVVSEIAGHAEELDLLTDGTASSVNQIAASLKQVASGVQSLFTETEDVSATMTELSKAISEVNNYTKEQAVLAEKVRENASRQGMDAIHKTMEGIERIKEEVTSTVRIVKNLGDMSSEIGKILEVINGITGATNLLSLNAAIIASQAGEHGKGFAVVADEVKALADRTSSQTKVIEELIMQVRDQVDRAVGSTKSGLERVEDGVTLSLEAESALKVIIESSEVSMEMAKKVESAVDEQSRGVMQITENIQRLNSMADDIKKATEEQNKASGDIVRSTENVKNFTHMVKKSTSEQAKEMGDLSKAIASASSRMKAIGQATSEQKRAVENILRSIETLVTESETNLNLAAKLDEMVYNIENQGTSLNNQVKSFNV